jgi:F-type H+-transporting ATPase subunit a
VINGTTECADLVILSFTKYYLEISIVPEKVFNIGNIEVTNAVLSAVIIILLLSVSLLVVSFKVKAFNSSKLQLFLEWVIDSVRDISNSIIGPKGRALFPFLFTFFLFVVLSNWFGLLPFVGPVSVLHNEQQASSIKHQIEEESQTANVESQEELIAQNSDIVEDTHGVEKEAQVDFWSCVSERNCYLDSHFQVIRAEKAFPLFRAPTSDVSATLALALISVIATNVLGFHFAGFGYIKKYINLSNPINFFIGLLELVSELGRIISFTFRLFGNVFAGEILLLVITSLSFGLATLPFMALELFVGFIQGFVFFMITTVFIGIALEHKH